ncbi:hypothetical protein ACFV2Q_04710 [Streptomyces sp. NPDC059650]|uniref:hypothetical protein n=1 Tax=Streptomyces sp. NPDC059650 TaxID=3346896 RepID=UPI00369D5FA9
MPQPPLMGLTAYLATAQWGEWDLPAAVLPAMRRAGARCCCRPVRGGAPSAYGAAGARA